MADDTPNSPDEQCEDDLYTDDTDTRFVGLNSLLAGALVLSLPTILVYAIYTGTALAVVTQPWFLLYATLVMMAATWSFGKETLEAVQSARGK